VETRGRRALGQREAPARLFRLEGGLGRWAARTSGRPPLPDEVSKPSCRASRVARDAVASLGQDDDPRAAGRRPDRCPISSSKRKATAARVRVYLEVMGYWSRAAVWKRVELVQAGLAERVLFAVSSRLSVSEEVLDGRPAGCPLRLQGNDERARDRRAPRPAGGPERQTGRGGCDHAGGGRPRRWRSVLPAGTGHGGRQPSPARVLPAASSPCRRRPGGPSPLLRPHRGRHPACNPRHRTSTLRLRTF
jgi:hypothetical protein